MKNLSFIKRLGFALAGIRDAWKRERSFRFQVCCALGIWPVMFVLGPELIWWAVVAIVVGMVLTTELINTSIEKLADHLHPDQHPSIGLVKDVAAGAVLVASLCSVLVAVLVVCSVL